MRLTKILSAMLVFVCPIVTIGQARPASCRIIPLWKDEQVRGSYSNDVGRFQADGGEGVTVRSFPYKDSVITAGINYVMDYSKRKRPPVLIELALIISDTAQKEIFETVEVSEAATIYKKGWNLTVTKNIKTGDVTHMFTLSCSDGLKLPRR